jgi:protease IV
VAKRGVRLVFGLLILAVLVSLAGIALMYFAVGAAPAVARNSTLVLRLDDDLHEVPTDGVVQQLLEGSRTTGLRAVLDALRKAKADPRVSSVLIVPANLQAPLWGKVQEVHDAVADFRKSGKLAIAYLEQAGEKEYYIATACDRIFLMPGASLDVNGLATYEVFLRGTLDKIGVYPDVLHIGDYKTAYNTFTEKGFTPAHREASEAMTRDLYEQLVRAIADGRKKSEADVRALIDEGPFSPDEALRLGLVDDLAYEDQIDDKAKLAGGRIARLESEDYARVSLRSLGLNRGPRIAVIYATGVISSGRGGYDPLSGVVMGSETVNKHIRDARADPSVRAIVLRIDSPGGSATASDAIWRELVITRDEKKDRPLVVSMSDLAASGGYWMAMAAPYIVAQPGTLTGSIGVITGKFVTGGLYTKLGANIESISFGKHAEIASPARPFNDAERQKIEALMQDTYDEFVEKAAAARHMPPEKLDAVAQGRVWTGRQAKAIGLVDELGGLDRAIAAAKQRAKIAAGSDVEIVVYPPRRSVYELLSEGFRADGGDSLLRVLALPADERRAIGTLAAPLLFRTGEPLALMPAMLVR